MDREREPQCHLINPTLATEPRLPKARPRGSGCWNPVLLASLHIRLPGLCGANAGVLTPSGATAQGEQERASVPPPAPLIRAALCPLNEVSSAR